MFWEIDILRYRTILYRKPSKILHHKKSMKPGRNFWTRNMSSTLFCVVHPRHLKSLPGIDYVHCFVSVMKKFGPKGELLRTTLMPLSITRRNHCTSARAVWFRPLLLWERVFWVELWARCVCNNLLAKVVPAVDVRPMFKSVFSLYTRLWTGAIALLHPRKASLSNEHKKAGGFRL